MKKLIKLIILVIIFQSCTTNKSLIYSIPIEMEKEILIELQKYDKKNVFFILNTEENNTIELSLVQIENIKKATFSYLEVINSNRKIRIDDKLYYLVFHTDRTYGTIIENQKKLQSIKEREHLYDTYQEEKIQGISKRGTMYHNGMYFKFKNNILIEKSW